MRSRLICNQVLKVFTWTSNETLFFFFIYFVCVCVAGSFIYASLHMACKWVCNFQRKMEIEPKKKNVNMMKMAILNRKRAKHAVPGKYSSLFSLLLNTETKINSQNGHRKKNWYFFFLILTSCDIPRKSIEFNSFRPCQRWRSQ